MTSSAPAIPALRDERDLAPPARRRRRAADVLEPRAARAVLRRDRRRRGRGRGRRAGRGRAPAPGSRASGCSAALAGRPGFYLPAHGEQRPAGRRGRRRRSCPRARRSRRRTPSCADMFLTEAARGCSRGCTYCVMRRSTNGGMRVVPRDDDPGRHPGRRPPGRPGRRGGHRPPRHPRAIVRDVVDGGRDGRDLEPARRQADDELVGLLARGGYRTLTVAGDGASERMRRVVERSTRADHLRALRRARARTQAAHAQGLHDARRAGRDRRRRRRAGRAVARARARSTRASPTAWRRSWPSATRRSTARPFAGIDVVEARLARLRRGLAAAGLAGKVEVRPDLGALGVGRVHARAGRDLRRARGDGRPPRRRQLRRVQEGVRGAWRGPDRAARARAVEPGADRAPPPATGAGRLNEREPGRTRMIVRPERDGPDERAAPTATRGCSRLAARELVARVGDGQPNRCRVASSPGVSFETGGSQSCRSPAPPGRRAERREVIHEPPESGSSAAACRRTGHSNRLPDPACRRRAASRPGGGSTASRGLSSIAENQISQSRRR